MKRQQCISIDTTAPQAQILATIPTCEEEVGMLLLFSVLNIINIDSEYIIIIY